MSEAAELLHGWFSMHDFRNFDRSRFSKSSDHEKAAFRNALMGFWEQNQKNQAERRGSFGIYEMLGHKADLLFLTLRPLCDELASLKKQMASWPLSETLKPEFSYFGVVELSNYVVSAEQRAEVQEMINKRLRPSLPERKHLCFYPMSKKREGQDNWYTLSIDERRQMMRHHGKTGRAHAESITQMISGSIGLDDWEWGVTLFADDPIAFKNVVTQMRFDEVSARYAQFGSFVVGNRLDREQFIKWFDSDSKA